MGKQEDFILSIVPYISDWIDFYHFGVVSAICAQACLESGYGTSDKARHNNYFGLVVFPCHFDLAKRVEKSSLHFFQKKFADMNFVCTFAVY